MQGCKEEDTGSYMTNEKAAAYFNYADSICSLERSMIWGENLSAPLMFINRDTREIFASAPDKEGILKARDGIYVGSYPRDMMVSPVAAVEIGGTLFGAVRLPGREDEFRIQTLMVHALFHRFQKARGIYTPNYQTSHLSERTARLWVKMEWKALQRAIRTSGEIRTQAIRDALVFRSARREMYPGFENEENHFEIYEGLTTFTYHYICIPDYDEYVKELLNYYENIYAYRSYTHSWGFASGSLYAHLLYEAGFDFSAISDPDTDLGGIAGELYSIELPEISRDIAGSLAFNYDIDLVNREETEREISISEGLRKRVSKYIDRPVVFLELQSPNFNFEPDDMDPVDTLGIIYNTLRVTDNWGRIAVDEGGCLVSPNFDFIRVPARNIIAERNHITGEGWQIFLNDSWEIVEVDENYYLRKLIP